MFDDIQRVILALSERAQKAELGADTRKLAIMAAKSLRRNSLERDLEGMSSVESNLLSETESWVGHKALAEGRGGPFDVLDLRCWLAIAERAGVAAVPAVTVVELTDAEMEAVSGRARLGDGPLSRGLRRLATSMMSKTAATGEPEAVAGPEPTDVEERLAAAMDGVPEGWMVRYARCGGSNLKALAGFGVAGPKAPEVRFGPDLELGPGWYRRGNRRVVDSRNLRTLQAAVSGPGEPHAFMARPWLAPARWAFGPDPHRHGTQYAGNGGWPAEWRAFVVDGKVEGVASYYGWCGAATSRNACIALAVRDLAQKVADEVVRQAALPRYLDLEAIRGSGHPSVEGDPLIVAEMTRLARDKVAMTLDFVEVFKASEPHGLALLEGGPPVGAFGGGHPCAFAGAGGRPRGGVRTTTDGVAFRLMDGVILADPSTWNDGDRTGRIVDWEEVVSLAASDGPQDDVPPSLRSGSSPYDYVSPVSEPDRSPVP